MAFTVPGLPQRAQQPHTSIFEAIKDGDPQAAQQAMHEDLLFAEENMRRAMALQERQEPS